MTGTPTSDQDGDAPSLPPQEGTVKTEKSRGYVVTGRYLGHRCYATEKIGVLSTAPEEAKVWRSVVAAHQAAAALEGRPGGAWIVIPEAMR